MQSEPCPPIKSHFLRSVDVVHKALTRLSRLAFLIPTTLLRLRGIYDAVHPRQRPTRFCIQSLLLVLDSRRDWFTLSSLARAQNNSSHILLFMSHALDPNFITALRNSETRAGGNLG